MSDFVVFNAFSSDNDRDKPGTTAKPLDESPPNAPAFDADPAWSVPSSPSSRDRGDRLQVEKCLLSPCPDQLAISPVIWGNIGIRLNAPFSTGRSKDKRVSRIPQHQTCSPSCSKQDLSADTMRIRIKAPCCVSRTTGHAPRSMATDHFLHLAPAGRFSVKYRVNSSRR